jgi:hypothetical protein
MTQFANLVAPSMQVEDSDQLLERAQALFDYYSAAMDSPNRDLAYSLLQQ